MAKKKQQLEMTAEQQAAARMDMMRKMNGILAEHFDAVQIVCLRLEPSGTTSRYVHGSGLLHARVQGCQSWINSCHVADVL